MTGEELIDLIEDLGLEDKEIIVRVMDGGIEKIVAVEEEDEYCAITTERH